jgi:DNA recombination protein Rad52
MKFNSEQISALSAPLSSQHVKSRSQSGRELSYIEGWHAIAEANRIFGFDAWSRQTIELTCIAEKERAIGKDRAPGWGVSYLARVRVTVGDLVREGCGTGHGIDRDLGQAHESALKEAETDAMKRALMTFGNPFGLALYDKTRAHVSDEPTTRENPHVTRPEDISDGRPNGEIPHVNGIEAQSKAKSRDTYAELEKEMFRMETLPGLMAWGKTIAATVATMHEDFQDTFRRRFAEYRDELRTAAEAAE